MSLTTSRRGWGPLIAHAVTVQVLTYALRPALPYGVLDVGGSTAILGLIGTAFAVPALLIAIPSSRLVDRLGERVPAVLGAALLVIAGVVSLLGIHSIPLLLVATLLLGMGHLLSVVSEQALVANRSAHGSREGAFGVYTLATSVGQTIGPLFLALPAPDHNGPWLRVIFGSCIVLALVVMTTSLMLQPTVRDLTLPKIGMFASTTSVLRSPGVLRALIAGGIALSSVDVTLAFWPALGQETGLAATAISAMLVARAIASMASRALLPWMSRRIPRKALLAGSLGASALAFAATAAPLPIVLLVIAAFLYGLAIGVCQPITMSWLADEAPVGQRGMAMSLRLVGNRMGQSTLPAAVGAVAPAAGAVGVILLTGASLVVASLVALGARRRAA